MMDTLHELKLHTEALEKSLKIARGRIDAQDEYILEIQDDLNHVSFKYSCLCAKLHLEEKNRHAASRN